MKEKFKVLFIPYVLTTTGLIMFFSLFNWICFIRFELFHLKNHIWLYYFPLFICIILIWFFFEERIRFYRFIYTWKKFDFKYLYFGILFFIIFLPTTLSQFYLYYASQDRTIIKSIDDIHKNKLTRFYNIEEFYIDKTKFGINNYHNYDGGKLLLNIDYAFPVFKTPEDTVKTAPIAWLGFPFHKVIDLDSITGSDIESREMQKFRKECDDRISKNNFRKFLSLERIDHSDLKVGLIKAVKKNNKQYKPNKLILIPEEMQPISFKAERILPWFIGALTTGPVIWFLSLFLLKPGSNSKFTPKYRSKLEYFKDFFEVVKEPS